MRPSEHSARLLDTAATWLLVAALLIVIGIRIENPLLYVGAWLPIRWGLFRVYLACRPAEPRSPATPPAKPFGYEQEGPER
jgi:hypothetical protein